MTDLNRAHIPQDYDRIINHACNELGVTRKMIASRFQIAEQFIGPEQISQLWIEYLRRR